MVVNANPESSHPNWVTEDNKYPFTIATADWDDYATHRPKLPASMFASWLQYHKDHGGNFDTAHDIGAGSGAGAAAIAPSFKHIYVSDPGTTNITTARQNLHPSSKFTFATQPADSNQEEAWPPTPSSIDFACMCNSLHWTNTTQALRNIATSLRPGGTFAACVNAFRVNFPGNDGLTKLWVAATSAIFGKFSADGLLSPAVLAGMSIVMEGYDGVEIPEELFTDVRRLKINTMDGDPEPFTCVDTSQFYIVPSQIKESEKVQYLRDENWTKMLDVAWLQGNLRTSTLPLGEEHWALPAWKEFEAAMKEYNGPVLAEWPVYVILATRK